MADVIYVTDIYPAREEPIPNVSGKLIFDEISKEKYYIASREKLAKEILKVAHPDDMIVIMGAGDIWKTGNELKQLLTQM